MYTALLTTHITCATLSIMLFLFRGGYKIARGQLPAHLFFRVAPHIVDTVLLAAAIGLTLQISQYPFINDWLTVKFFALIGYIILGSIALKRTQTRAATTVAVVAATLLFAYIVSVAWYHLPLGFAVWFVATP